MMYLASAGPGSTVRLLAVQAGRELQSRLASMGLVPGVSIEVVTNSMRGPVVIAAGGSRLMLGRGMAQKVLVR